MIEIWSIILTSLLKSHLIIVRKWIKQWFIGCAYITLLSYIVVYKITWLFIKPVKSHHSL